jgi:hypothetical protein
VSEAEARRVVTERAGGRCELCAATEPLTYAHRLNRSHGGPWAPSNACRLCGSGTTGCHGWTEREPLLAYAGGWRIPYGDPRAPGEVPVWLAIWGGTWPGWFLLADEGTYRPVDNGPPPELPPWVRLAGHFPADGPPSVASGA